MIFETNAYCIKINKKLDELLIRILDHYGIETDFIDKTIFKLNSTNMTDEKFPAVTSLSDTITFKRKTAMIEESRSIAKTHSEVMLKRGKT